MIRSHHWMFAAASAGFLFAGHAAAVPTASFQLQQTSLTSTEATFDVSVIYEDGPDGSALAFLQLDVAASSPAFFPGNDFSRFTFTPGVALANWTEFLFDTPGFGQDDSIVAFDTFTVADMLLEGTHLLGSLSVNLAGLAPGLVVVELAPPSQAGGTDAGQEDVPGQGPFTLLSSVDGGIDVSDAVDRFVITPSQPPTGVVPEPASLLLGAIAAGALALRRRKA